MRVLVLCVLLIPTGALRSDPSPPTNVDAILKAVDERMRGIENFQATCARTDIHPLTGFATQFTNSWMLRSRTVAATLFSRYRPRLSDSVTSRNSNCVAKPP
jgi:hypothetical protein